MVVVVWLEYKKLSIFVYFLFLFKCKIGLKYCKCFNKLLVFIRNWEENSNYKYLYNVFI